MSKKPRNYETLVPGTLMEARDRFGRYREASFSHKDEFVNAISRDRDYNIWWATDKRLKEIYEGIEKVYNLQELIPATSMDGDTFLFDPDGWKGLGHNDLRTVEFELGKSQVRWDKYSLEDAEGLPITYTQLAVSEPKLRFAPLVHAELSSRDREASEKIFADISLFLE